MNTILCPSGLLASWIESSVHSVSNHPTSSLCDGLVFGPQGLPPRHFSPKFAPTGKGVCWASPLESRLATTSGRIEFVAYGLDIHLLLLST